MQAATDLLHEAYLQEHWLAVAALKASEARATTTLFPDMIQLQEVEARGILCRDILSEWLQEMHSILVLWHNAVQDILEVSPSLSFDVTGCLLAVALAVPLYRLLLRARLALRWPLLNMAPPPDPDRPWCPEIAPTVASSSRRGACTCPFAKMRECYAFVRFPSAAIFG